MPTPARYGRLTGSILAATLRACKAMGRFGVLCREAIGVIVFVTTRFYGLTVRIFVENKLKLDVPPTAVWSYDQLFRADQVPAATFILTDLERLYPWEA